MDRHVPVLRAKVRAARPKSSVAFPAFETLMPDIKKLHCATNKYVFNLALVAAPAYEISGK
jgi:hypothetical protein